MCYFALMGVRAEVLRLRAAIQRASDVFDTDVVPEPRQLASFPSSDVVVCITLGGCSCALVAALERVPGHAGHAITHSATFRAVIANVTRCFGSSRLLVHQERAGLSRCEPRSTSLTAFLGSSRVCCEELLNIVA